MSNLIAIKQIMLIMQRYKYLHNLQESDIIFLIIKRLPESKKERENRNCPLLTCAGEGTRTPTPLGTRS